MKETVSNNCQSVDAMVLQEALHLLSYQFRILPTKLEIESVIILSEPCRRNLVLRIILTNPSNELHSAPKSIILQQSLTEESCEDDKEALRRFVRDWAGLEFLSNLETQIPIAPKFYGGSIKYRFILIEDLGHIHTSLVDALMGVDRGAAKKALNRYVKAMSTLHGNAINIYRNYQAIVRKLSSTMLICEGDLDNTLIKISPLLEKFNIPLSADLKNEITLVLNLAKKPGSFTTLTHGDICPDNVFDYPAQNKMYIIDFEFSFIGNALLDAVALRMCMPTCWCAKAFPEEIIESFEQMYREELKKYIPAADDDIVYYEYYTAACAYWMLWLVASLDDILETEVDMEDLMFSPHPAWKPEYNLRRPRSIYRFKAFITTSKKNDLFPCLILMAEAILKKLEEYWPNVKPLELYPAFNKNM